MLREGLEQRLQSSLGSAYALDRELGGGGMSRVFVAATRLDEALHALRQVDLSRTAARRPRPGRYCAGILASSDCSPPVRDDAQSSA